MNTSNQQGIYPKNVKMGKPQNRISQAFIINDKCVITKNQTLKVLSTYDLVDFLDNLGIALWRVLFISAKQEGDIIKIKAFDLKTKKLIHRSHDIKGEVCDWVLTDITSTNDEEIIDYCENY